MYIIIRSGLSIDVTKFLTTTITEITEILLKNYSYVLFISFVLFSYKTNSTKKR